MSIFSPARCVLLLSDEGVAVYTTGSKVALVESLSWDTPELDVVLGDVIARRCPGKSVLILNDMVEQHYRKERIPKVSPLDKPNIIKRRVTAAFPSYPIRASLAMKEKAHPRTKGDAGPLGEIYLFAAVPLSEYIRKTLGGIQKSYASIFGFGLLPVESAQMVHALSKKLRKTSDRPAIWTVFVGQHQNGGLRQIVTKNGELALTRMTPIVDSDIDHDLWASEVAAELKGTMSYLSRFGFDPDDGLDVIVIANNAVAENIVSKVDFECNLSVLTAAEASNLLGLKIGRQEEQRYADPLHLAWIGKKPALTMPLKAIQLDMISNPAKAALAATLLLLAACGYLSYYTYNEGAEWLKDAKALESAQQLRDTVLRQHNEELDKKKDAGFDFLLVDKATKVYRKLDTQSMKPLAVFDVVARNMGPKLTISSFTVQPVSSAEATDPSVPPAAEGTDVSNEPAKFDMVLKIGFPSNIQPEEGNAELRDLLDRLRASLPNHQIEIAKQVADMSYSGTFVGEATAEKKEKNELKDYEGQIRITGEML